MLSPDAHNRFIVFFDDIPEGSQAYVGLKTYYQAYLKKTLVPSGIKIPDGFGITTKAFANFIATNQLHDEIMKQLSTVSLSDIAALRKAARIIRKKIIKATLPQLLEQEIRSSYRQLTRSKVKTRLIVRPSTYTPDDPEETFAGQHDSVFDIQTEDACVEAIRNVYASLYTERGIAYRIMKNIPHDHVLLGITVQHMVNSDQHNGCAGTYYSYDVQTHHENIAVIHATKGLGRKLVAGMVEPDEFIIFKSGIANGHSAVIDQNLSKHQGARTPCIHTDELVALARWGLHIEELVKSPLHYEWAKDGSDNKLYIVQISPKKLSNHSSNVITTYKLKTNTAPVVATGTAVGSQIAHGKARVITDIRKIGQFKNGEVLITDMTNPDWEPILKKAAAIVTDTGGRTAHAAIVSREMGIPAIVGTDIGTKAINTGDTITINCSRGDIGLVHQGTLPFTIQKTKVNALPTTKTRMLINTGEPSLALSQSQLPCDGVGLARVEFIINESIKVHPLALLHPKKITHEATKKRIAKKMEESGFTDRGEFFTAQLASGIAKIAAAFYPRQVIVRLSDYKTDEYRHLIGGDDFEPLEQNPMLGWRGASRYYDPRFKEAFALECAAFNRVRNDFGLDNITLLVPFVRTVEEAKKVIAVLKENGIKRGKKDWNIYMMIEVPSNVILIDQFAKLFDGFSIGTNDLTQLTLGLDRGSQLVSDIYDERNPAIKEMVRQVIHAAHKHKKKIGICGQAPSDFPEFATFITKEGIDSISVNPDVLLKTRLRVAKVK